MADPFIGEIRPLAFTFAPRGWAMCDGQLLSISQNQALFSLLGTMYGGDGRTTFALPDLRGRAVIGQGSGPGLQSYSPGDEVGVETHALSVDELPPHNHWFGASNATATQSSPEFGTFAKPAVHPRMGTLYHHTAGASADPSVITPTGDSQPHENRQPFGVVAYAIALQGLFPSRN